MKLRDGVEVGEDDVTFSGASGKQLLLAIILRAKFSEPYQSLTLFNDWMADLATRLSRDLHPEGPPTFSDDPHTRQVIARLIAAEGAELGWWRMSFDAKAAFLQMAAAPYRMTSESVEEIILSVDDEVDDARRLVAAADQRDRP